MNTTTEALEPELDRPASTDGPVRFHYPARTLLYLRVTAGVLILPLCVALAVRSTGAFAVIALLLALAGGWLLVQAQRRVSGRPGVVTVAGDGLSTGGPGAGAVAWSDISVVRQSRILGYVQFGTRKNARAATVDFDLAGIARLLELSAHHVAVSRTGEEAVTHHAGADGVFRRALTPDIALLAIAEGGILLGLLIQPAYFLVALAGLPVLLWHWAAVPYGVAVDDTAIWILRPLARDVIPLRAISNVEFGVQGRLATHVVTIHHRDRGAIAIAGLNAAALPLFDAIVATRARVQAAARTGPATARSGSAIRQAVSPRAALVRAGGVLLACVCIAWVSILTGIPLRSATQAGNATVVRIALLAGSPRSAAGFGGLTALHHAAAGGHDDIARALLDHGADANAASADGLTPLHIAAALGYGTIVDLLVGGGADVNARSASGRTPLADAAAGAAPGDTTSARLLLAGGADPDIADGAGRAPLHYAAMNGSAEMIRRLARAGADVEAADTTGDRSLHAAVAAGQQDAAAALLAAGAAADARGSGGRTALAAAASAGAPVALANVLLEAGASTAISGDDGWNAVQLAVRTNNIEMLELFARQRASLNATDGRVAPALWLAAENGQTDAARALLRGGASPGVRWNGRSALQVAASKRNATLVALMRMR